MELIKVKFVERFQVKGKFTPTRNYFETAGALNHRVRQSRQKKKYKR